MQIVQMLRSAKAVGTRNEVQQILCYLVNSTAPLVWNADMALNAPRRPVTWQDVQMLRSVKAVRTKNEVKQIL